MQTNRQTVNWWTYGNSAGATDVGKGNINFTRRRPRHSLGPKEPLVIRTHIIIGTMSHYPTNLVQII